MFRRAHCLSLLACVAATAPSFSQTTDPRKPPEAPTTQTSPVPATTLKANAQIVIVDVVVTDSRQRPVHNLKASDFAVSENGALQHMVSFEEHVAPPPSAAAIKPAMPRLPPGIFSNYSPAPAGAAVNVLLLDALNTPMKDQAYVREQLRDYLRSAPSGTRIAIFGLNERLILLQGFTSDLSLLKSVVDGSGPASSRQLPDNVGNGGTKPPSQMMTDVMGDAADMTQLVTSVQQFEAVQGAIDTQNRALQTMDALDQIAHFLGAIPGRKNLIWFSGSFPLDIFPDGSIANRAAVVVNMEDRLHQTTNLLARAQVAVYPIDAGGLKTNAVAIGNDSGPGSFGAGLAAAQVKQFQDSTGQHATMNLIAADTGGRAYFDTNGLTQAVSTVVENGSNFYTLAYTPSDPAQDGRFRRIQIKLAQPGTELTYRNGYYADEPAGKSTRKTEDALLPAQPNSLTRVMMHGAPEASEILLKLQILPASTTTEDKVAPNNIFNAAPAKALKIKGPFRRYAIDIAAAARDLSITPTPEGRYQFSAEIVTCVFTPAGVLINTAVEKAHGNLSPSSLANMIHTGVPFHQEVSVPVRGEYYLRTSVHDLNTDHYGTVEIPVSAISNLAPLSAIVPSSPDPTGR